MAAPRIALPARLSDGSGADPRVALANAIFDDVAALVTAQGLEAVVVTTADLTGFDGVVLPGGGDIDPSRYGGDTAALLYDVNAEQDRLDLDVTRAAIAAGMPVLGVCRGLQVINVAFGGTLIEDLPGTAVSHRAADDGCGTLAWAWHRVDLSPSPLREAYLTSQPVVASGHHQAIGLLGEGLRVIARADDGTIEAVDHPTLPLVAVQWHPEAAGTPAADAAAPFRLLAERARARSLPR